MPEVGTSFISESPSGTRLGVAATYKSREVEGVFDLLFYRKVGFHLARFFAGLGFTPSAVTLIGGVFGVVAGHFYFYRSVVLNLVGFALHITANAFDNADGQLARLTNQQSRSGRILDLVVDHIIWISIYVHLTLRLWSHGFSAAIIVLAIAAGLSHALQATAGDCWRHAYLYFGKRRGELDSAAVLEQEYQRLNWRDNGWSKILLALYLGGIRQQELLFPGIKRLHEKVGVMSPQSIPDWFRSRYEAMVGPTFRWWGLLLTNSRMLILFILFLVQRPVWFFWIEVTVGNVLLFFLILQQQRMTRSLTDFFTAQKASA